MLGAEEWYVISEMREKGMSISKIVRQMGMSMNAVKRHLKLNRSMEYRRGKRFSNSIL